MYVVLTTVSILYVLRYARKVKKNPGASLSEAQEGDDLLAAESGAEVRYLGREVPTLEDAVVSAMGGAHVR